MIDRYGIHVGELYFRFYGMMVTVLARSWLPFYRTGAQRRLDRIRTDLGYAHLAVDCRGAWCSASGTFSHRHPPCSGAGDYDHVLPDPSTGDAHHLNADWESRELSLAERWLYSFIPANTG